MSDSKLSICICTTDYSLLDGAIQIKPLAKRVEELGMQACAMTDHGNMFGAISFYNAMKARGVKPNHRRCETYIGVVIAAIDPQARRAKKRITT